MDFKKIEQKWQKKWDGSFHVDEKGEKYYVLEMFPYPSGEGLHVGHAFNYTIGDIFARYKRLQGKNVLHPMGYDSLGLPAENAAIKKGIPPQEYTEKAIGNFKQQQKSLGISYDWGRCINTSDPSYYGWDQWIFLQLFKKGLAYKKKSPVNWCPECHTVLANEQVHDGTCWRHTDKEVEVKNLEQWYFKITEYAEELNDMSKLDEWPEVIKKLQKNWIGKSKGTEVTFTINETPWKVFTTRPDTLYGVTFLVISAQHNALMDIVTDEQKEDVEAFVKKQHSVSQETIDTLEKEGVFTGTYAIHPLTKEKIPVYVGNFVLAEYGSGMVMAVPAHDKRDYAFAKKYDLPIKQVVEGTLPHTTEGNLMNADVFTGMNSEKAKDKITHHLEKIGKGKEVTQWRLKDWLISRQRYWGTPIPIINCETCGTVPVPESDLPVTLPTDISFGKGNPIETSTSFHDVSCPQCGKDAKRETDTMDTFVNSSWYQLRYADPKNEKEIFSSKKVNFWNPVDLYIGGKEHACMHLIYIRFYTKFLRDLGLLSFDEPAKKLFNQGLLHAEDGNKMSKSLGNVINPLDIIETEGADALRFFLVSVASPDSDFSWSTKGLESSKRFLEKVYDFYSRVQVGSSSKRSNHYLNKAIQKITQQIEEMKYNLAIITLRETFSTFEEEMSKESLESYLSLLHPFCPHLTEELWEKLGNERILSFGEWPKVNESAIAEKIEAQELLKKTVEEDIEAVKKLAGEGKVKVFIAEAWKYEAMKKIQELLENTRNPGDIIPKVKKEGKEKEISAMVLKIIKDPSKMPETILSQKEEKEILQEYDVVLEQDAKEPKAKQAMPGKPALLLT